MKQLGAGAQSACRMHKGRSVPWKKTEGQLQTVGAGQAGKSSLSVLWLQETQPWCSLCSGTYFQWSPRLWHLSSILGRWSVHASAGEPGALLLKPRRSISPAVGCSTSHLQAVSRVSPQGNVFTTWLPHSSPGYPLGEYFSSSKHQHFKRGGLVAKPFSRAGDHRQLRSARGVASTPSEGLLLTGKTL